MKVYFLGKQAQFLFLAIVIIILMITHSWLNYFVGFTLPLELEILIIWLLVVYEFKLDHRALYLVALLLLLMCSLSLIIGMETLSEEIAAYVYLFLILGAIQQFFKMVFPKDQ